MGDTKPRRNNSILVALVAMLLILLMKGALIAPPKMRQVNAETQFDTFRAVSRLQRVLGDERPHFVDSAANDVVRDRLIAEIRALGYEPEIRDDFSCRLAPSWGRIGCARVRNIVFHAGPDPFVGEANAIMVASHYDSVPTGPGANDDGIGVAASLEIAHHLVGENLPRPVVFLISDGEEFGLLGAASFVRKDPLADRISDVINMEARGATGPVQMFQTSYPNADDVSTFSKGAARPVSNSLMTDIYRLLPNDTDMTEFLDRGYSGLNFAITGALELYHTPKDDLAHLDGRSVQHMGDLALGAVRTSLGIEASETPKKGNVVFIDFISRFFIILPSWAGPFSIILGGLCAAIGFVKSGVAQKQIEGSETETSTWRVLLTPPAALLMTVCLTFTIQLALGALRPGASYWSAFPLATQLLIYLCSAMGVAISLKMIAKRVDPTRLVFSVWVWIALVGIVASVIVPGAAILFALPLLVFSVLAVLGLALPITLPTGMAVAGLFLLFLFAPLLYLIEIGLGLGLGAVIAFMTAILFLAILPLTLRENTRIAKTTISLLTGMTALAGVVCLLLPAYSPDRPGAVNLVYNMDVSLDQAHWIVASGDKNAHKKFIDFAPFTPSQIDGHSGRTAAQAPDIGLIAPEVSVLSNEDVGESRRLQLNVSTNGADTIMLNIPEEAKVRSVRVGDDIYALNENERVRFDCRGRACSGLELEFELKEKSATEWTIIGTTTGLPPAGIPLLDLRPNNMSPVHSGDVTMVRKKKVF